MGGEQRVLLQGGEAVEAFGGYDVAEVLGTDKVGCQKARIAGSAGVGSGLVQPDRWNQTPVEPDLY